ncbi:FAD-dependent oxidoreductase [Halobacillus litoralis]|uniref:FAD-dependent oxidoreductase n=1 Tax=Halobacillus litoralis TaxID=45668 RepID=UPI002490FE7E|nr:FAD-dependent oxidoreductase [Halobacillus litoralis]
MSFLKDKLSIFTKTELPFIKRYQESDRVYTFLFEKDKDLSWNEGQHGLFTITHKKMKDSIRPFSVASSPSEGVVRITTKIDEEPSEFKKALLELEEGMRIKMIGPVGSFYLKDETPRLFMAGGIGITPFRAILKQLEAEGNRGGKPSELLYVDSQEAHLYKDELDELARDTSIDVHYLSTRNDMYSYIDEFITSHNNNAQYFVSGPKSMTNYLKEKHISKRKIKKDAFRGVE